MAKIDLKETRKIIQKIEDAALKKQNLKSTAEETAKIIRRRTRLGFGVEEFGGTKTKLEKLSQSYKDFRAGKVAFFQKEGKVLKIDNPKQKPKLSDQTSVGKSNLTFTGQLLNSLKGSSKQDGSITIEPTGTREDGLTNKKLSNYVSEIRPYLSVTAPEIKQITNFLRMEIQKRIRKILTQT